MFGGVFPNPLTGISYTAAADLQAHKQWTFEKLREHKIVKAVVDFNTQWYAEEPDRVLLGHGRGDLTALRRLHEAGQLHVMAEMTNYYKEELADDPSVAPYFELAEELQLPVGYHIYPGGPPGALYMGGYPGVRASNANPMQLENVLLEHPSLKVYVMHAGWPYLDDMKALMYAHPQVYVDLGVISWALPRAEFHAYLKGLVDAGFGTRIMYGTDQMAFIGTFDQAIESVNSAPFLSLDQKADIFYYNAARFLDLSEEEMDRHHQVTTEK
jgi:predicted TIM-barrel fold metal-dependent hydrolase